MKVETKKRNIEFIPITITFDNKKEIIDFVKYLGERDGLSPTYELYSALVDELEKQNIRLLP